MAGQEYRPNSLLGWYVADARTECPNAAANRNIHLLTRQLGDGSGTLEMQVNIGRVGGSLSGKGSTGFRVGIRVTAKDYPELHHYRNRLWPANGAEHLARDGAPAR